MDLPVLTVSDCYNHCVVISSSITLKYLIVTISKILVNLISKIYIHKHFVRHMCQKYLFCSDIMTTIRVLNFQYFNNPIKNIIHTVNGNKSFSFL